MTTYEPQPRPRPVKAVLDQQRQDAERDRQRRATPIRPSADTVPPRQPTPAVKPAADIVPSAKQALPAEVPDNRTALQRLLDRVAPTSLVGQLALFNGKDGKFFINETGEEIDREAPHVVISDLTAHGYTRFNGKGETPETHMALIFDPDYVEIPRAPLGDTDATQWEIGLSGRAEDPYRETFYVVLQNAESGEFVTFSTSNPTGRTAVGRLINHIRRLERLNPGHFPVVRLRPGGYMHPDERVGFVHTPSFAVVGKQPKESTAKPDTSPQADFDDQIPY